MTTAGPYRSRISSQLGQLLRQAVNIASLPCHFSQSWKIPLRGLRCDDPGSSLLDWQHHPNLFSMRTNNIFMGQECCQRHVLECYCSLSERVRNQSNLGYCGGCASDAHIVDAPDAEVEEIGYLGGVWHGYYVRLALNLRGAEKLTAAKLKNLHCYSFSHLRYHSPRLYRHLLQHGQRQYLE